jgi:hypothetical protein
MFRPGLRVDDTLQRSGQAAFGALERAVRDLLGIPASRPFSASQRNALLATWSVVHGFANLALAGQLDGFAQGGDRQALLRKTLAPLLEQQLTALVGRQPARSGTSNARRLR